MRAGYGYRQSPSSERARVIIEMPKEELSAIDAYGVPAGMPSRTATIRMLLKRGLEAVQKGGTVTAGEPARA